MILSGPRTMIVGKIRKTCDSSFGGLTGNVSELWYCLDHETVNPDQKFEPLYRRSLESVERTECVCNDISL